MLPAIAAALPGVALGLVCVTMLAASVFGRHPFWHSAPLNIAEAAAMHDGASVVVRLKHGESAFARREIRSGLLFDHAVHLSPIEAAIASRRPEVLMLILSESPDPSADAWNRARCAANSVADDEITAVLERFRPKGTQVDCTALAPLW